MIIMIFEVYVHVLGFAMKRDRKTYGHTVFRKNGREKVCGIFIFLLNCFSKRHTGTKGRLHFEIAK